MSFSHIFIYNAETMPASIASDRWRNINPVFGEADLVKRRSSGRCGEPCRRNDEA